MDIKGVACSIVMHIEDLTSVPRVLLNLLRIEKKRKNGRLRRAFYRFFSTLLKNSHLYRNIIDITFILRH